MPDIIHRHVTTVQRGGSMISGNNHFDDSVVLDQPEYNKFDLSHTAKFTGKMGTLYPATFIPVIPGDKFRITADAFARLQPLVYPIMDQLEQSIHMFYVPASMVEPRFEQFFTGGTDGQYANKRLRFDLEMFNAVDLSFLDQWSDTDADYRSKLIGVGSLLDFMNYGLTYADDELVRDWSAAKGSVMVGPLLAYQRIYNDKYRNENYEADQFLIPSCGSLECIYNTYTTLGLEDTASLEESVAYAFTNCQGFIQAMNEVLSDPSLYEALLNKFSISDESLGLFYSHRETANSCAVGDIQLPTNTGGTIAQLAVQRLAMVWICMLLTQHTITYDRDQFTTALPFTQRGADVNLVKNVKATNVTASSISPLTAMSVFSTATATAGSEFDVRLKASSEGVAYTKALNIELDMNDIRQLNAAVRFLERNARIGYRLAEYVLGRYGIKSKRAELVEPDYFGGLKSLVQVDTIMSTSGTTEASLGEYAGAGTAYEEQKGIMFECDEPGYIFALYCMKPKTSYMNVHLKTWDKFYDRTLLYTPEFAHLTEQPLASYEIDAKAINWQTQAAYANAGISLPDSSIFGYIPRYNEYRAMPSTVHGELKSNLLNYTTARFLDFTNESTNSKEFQHVSPNDENVERIFQVSSDSADQFIAAATFNIDALRVMPSQATPSL